MGYPLAIALRYLASKKRAFVSIGTVFATLGVALGVGALTIVMSVTGGFQEQFREKVLGVNAHVLVLKYSIDFREYRDVMRKIEGMPGVIGMAPFVINPMMVSHGERTATGVLLKGVDPEQMPKVLDLPKQIVAGSLEGLRRPGAKPPAKQGDVDIDVRIPGDELRTSLDAEDAGAGADGGKLGLLDAIERQIAEDDARAARGNAPAPAKVEAPAPVKGVITDGPLMPSGDVTPSGGFASQLPDDDVLPEALDPDPCGAKATAGLPGAVVGKSLAKQLGVGLGDCIQVTSPTIGIAYGASGRPPIAKQFRVIAMFEAGFDQYDSKLVYADLYEAQAFYEYGDSVTGIEMKVDDIDQAKNIARAIEKVLANGIYHTLDWRELNHGLFTALLIQKLLMSFVLALMIVVAAFTVVATLIMMVLDKKREIGILKALGARDDAILRVFLYQGGIIGIVGTTVGLALGYAGCHAFVAYGFPLDPKVYFISKLPINIQAHEFALAGIFAIGICLLATLLPALHAARLRPVDGFRGD
jgi:lipoprotein-releasing system permease protein